MKWYSAAEHTPILSDCCILLAIFVPDTGNIYLELGVWDNGYKTWDDRFDIELNHVVLYFCYPDPIPEAYDVLMERYGEKTNA